MPVLQPHPQQIGIGPGSTVEAEVGDKPEDHVSRAYVLCNC